MNTSFSVFTTMYLFAEGLLCARECVFSFFLVLLFCPNLKAVAIDSTGNIVAAVSEGGQMGLWDTR